MATPAPLVMLQAQDLLELGSEARMNTPGRATRNWRWRLPPNALTPKLARRLRTLTTAAGR
jgi:4-alpha-glucanotransferase